MLTFTHGSGTLSLTPEYLAIAGWAGRDQAGVKHHIEELAELGVQPPSATPLFYRVGREQLTQHDVVQMLGSHGSGEVEACLMSDAQGTLWVTVASDHTDRKLEAVGVAESKQLCAKPVAREAWRFDEVESHWDQIEMSSVIAEDGQAVTYQLGTLAELLDVPTLLAQLPAPLASNGTLAPGCVLLCGTVPTRGGIRPSQHFSMSLYDPVLGRTLRHAYRIEELEVIK
ncbi:DUF2848 domain-containing protein [Halomonas aquatica]|uniref:DUF2848 domain-containing protein n=1 Tax=Halomonas aquatica TaxID=3151123 RepID=A0ABV1NDJ8_9GAMM